MTRRRNKKTKNAFSLKDLVKVFLSIVLCYHLVTLKKISYQAGKGTVKKNHFSFFFDSLKHELQFYNKKRKKNQEEKDGRKKIYKSFEIKSGRIDLFSFGSLYVGFSRERGQFNIKRNDNNNNNKRQTVCWFYVKVNFFFF